MEERAGVRGRTTVILQTPSPGLGCASQLLSRGAGEGFEIAVRWCRRYSAAARAGSMNCDSQELRRFTLARYIASNSAAGKECVDGRFINASVHAFSRGNFSMIPFGLI